MENILDNHAQYVEGRVMENSNESNLDSQKRYLFPQISVSDNLKFLSNIPDNTVKTIITSPPYNIGKNYEKRGSIDTYLAKQRLVIEECVRVLHPQGSICWQVGNFVRSGEIIPLDILLHPIFCELGLQMRNRIIWHFEHGLHCRNRFSGRYETINWYTKNNDYTFNLDPVRVPSKYPNKRHFKGPNKGKLSGNPLGKNPGDLWIFPNVKSNHVEKTIHPCQFPIELVERLVLSLSDKGDIVLDPYLGVGSTMLGALMHDRGAMGCDTNPEYIRIAWERYNKLISGTLKTRPMNKPVYDPSLPKGGHR